jgi:MFS family permease
LREPGFAVGQQPAVREQSIVQALREAFGYRSFQLLMAGYFVCGFQVVFIGVHMPSYLKDNGLSPQVASYALAIIGLFNVFGTYAAGVLGQKLAKRKILVFIYIMRSVAISLFLLAPLTPWSVYLFAAAMGLLWLSTVPPTNAIVAQVFGVAHLSMLGGFVFFSHQVGSFMGVWLGGLLYDRTGSYDIVWYISIALGVFAAVVNWPVRETPIQRGPQRVMGASGMNAPAHTTPPPAQIAHRPGSPPVGGLALAGLDCGAGGSAGHLQLLHRPALHGRRGRQNLGLLLMSNPPHLDHAL